jgi:hypothetical protein
MSDQEDQKGSPFLSLKDWLLAPEPKFDIEFPKLRMRLRPTIDFLKEDAEDESGDTSAEGR